MQSHNSQYIAGVDEVGRGPLAGPVVAAAVILNEQNPIIGLTDSKKLSPKKRALLAQQIKEQSLAFAIVKIDAPEIDRINILQATMKAMREAVLALPIQPHLCLIDGNRCPQLPMPCQAIVKGDLKEPCISAASIIAKVYRDNLMTDCAELYPGYGFEKHKGYPTKQHLEAIVRLGITPIHRKSYAPVQASLPL